MKKKSRTIEITEEELSRVLRQYLAGPLVTQAVREVFANMDPPTLEPAPEDPDANSLVLLALHKRALKERDKAYAHLILSPERLKEAKEARARHLARSKAWRDEQKRNK